MDMITGIKRIIATGKVEFGTKSTIDNIRNGKAKAVIIADNTPLVIKQDIEQYSKIGSIPLVKFRGTALTLGEVCGKPFIVTSIAILNAGDVKLKELIEEKQ
jgi:large subunit ribosomal protein L30e